MAETFIGNLTSPYWVVPTEDGDSRLFVLIYLLRNDSLIQYSVTNNHVYAKLNLNALTLNVSYKTADGYPVIKKSAGSIGDPKIRFSFSPSANIRMSAKNGAGTDVTYKDGSATGYTYNGELTTTTYICETRIPTETDTYKANAILSANLESNLILADNGSSGLFYVNFNNTTLTVTVYKYEYDAEQLLYIYVPYARSFQLPTSTFETYKTIPFNFTAYTVNYARASGQTEFTYNLPAQQKVLSGTTITVGSALTSTNTLDLTEAIVQKYNTNWYNKGYFNYDDPSATDIPAGTPGTRLIRFRKKYTNPDETTSPTTIETRVYPLRSGTTKGKISKWLYNGTNYEPGASIVVNSNITLTGNTELQLLNQARLQNVTMRQLPTQTGNTFTGNWECLSINGNSAEFSPGSTVDLFSDTYASLNSHWYYCNQNDQFSITSTGVINTNKIYFRPHGATLSTYIQENVKYNVPTQLIDNRFTKTNHKFAGWAESTSGDVVYGDKAIVTLLPNGIDETKNLYALWKYTIEFRKNAPTGATVTGSMSNMTAYYDKTFTLPANGYSCVGYAFVGWKDQSNHSYTNLLQIASDLADIVGSDTVTLLALWKPIKSLKVKINNSWKLIKTVKVKIGGAWKDLAVLPSDTDISKHPSIWVKTNDTWKRLE